MLGIQRLRGDLRRDDHEQVFPHGRFGHILSKFGFGMTILGLRHRFRRSRKMLGIQFERTARQRNERQQLRSRTGIVNRIVSDDALSVNVFFMRGSFRHGEMLGNQHVRTTRQRNEYGIERSRSGELTRLNNGDSNRKQLRLRERFKLIASVLVKKLFRPTLRRNENRPPHARVVRRRDYRHFRIFGRKPKRLRNRFMKDQVHVRQRVLKRLSFAAVRLIFPNFRLGMIGMNKPSGYGKSLYLRPNLLMSRLQRTKRVRRDLRRYSGKS